MNKVERYKKQMYVSLERYAMAAKLYEDGSISSKVLLNAAEKMAKDFYKYIKALNK